MKTNIQSGTEFLTVEQVSQLLKVKCSWVYSHAEEIGCFRVGKYLRFKESEIEERLRQRPLGQQPNSQD